MNRTVAIRDDFGVRTFHAEDFPLQIGGAGADVRLQELDQEPLAYVGLVEGIPFIKPAAPLKINGEPASETSWLRDGDVVVFDQAHLACRLQGGDFALHAASRRAGLTPAPTSVDDNHARIEPVAYQAGAGAGADTGIAHSHRKIQVALAGVFALLAVVGWFMFTARSVDLVISPEPESVDIKGTVLKARVGGRLLLRPGDYVVLAEREGYIPLRTPIKVGKASSQQFALQMEKLPGLLSIDSGELAAEVVIDGQVMGVTPLVNSEVPAGLHSLVVRARNHLPYTSEIEITGLGEKQQLQIVLQPNWAPVSVSSTPPGASVLVDGELFGATPITAEVEAGDRKLSITHPGYKAEERQLQVVAGEAVELPQINLVEADGRVAVNSTPAGANVTVDGVFKGRTPVEVMVSPGNRHTIALTKPGYQAARRVVTLEPDESERLAVNMTPILGTVRIVASPEDAELLVDGRSSGQANQVLSLTAAPHQIEVRKRGYAPHVETVTPREGYEKRLTVVLKTIAEAQAAVLEPVITTAGGQTMRLIRLGTFQMGSPRREQGRRSNEIRRDVELTREFYISETEVTNAQYKKFMSTHDSGFVGGLSLNGDQQPVVRLAWQQAARYCNWLSAKEGLPAAYVERDGRLVGRRPMTTGYRMPTEAEWVWVARFAGGATAMKFPWGNQMPPPQGVANLADNAARGFVAQRIQGYDDGYSVTAPVGSFAPNRLGLRDLGGNVAEWLHDFYEASSDDPFLSLVDPQGPEKGSRYVIRGSSWMNGSITELRAAYRDYGAQGRADLGFRLARYAR